MSRFCNFSKVLGVTFILLAMAASIFAQGYVDYKGRKIGTREEPILYHDKVGYIPQSTHTDAAPLQVPLPGWHHSVFGASIGLNGLEIVDVDGDGQNEIVHTSSIGSFSPPTRWSITEFRNGNYEIERNGANYEDTIDALSTRQMDSDPALEIVVCVLNRIYVYDGVTLQKQADFSSPITMSRRVNIADVDSDGSLEIVGAGDQGFVILDANTGVVEFFKSEYVGTDCAVGNLDGDSTLEIVIARPGGTSYVLNGATHLPEWTYYSGFGFRIDLGNIDSDPHLEIVGTEGWQVITFYDHALRSPIYDLTSLGDIGEFKLQDVNTDGIVEVIIGNSQWGEIQVRDIQEGALMWSVQNPLHGITRLAYGDADNDSIPEIIYGAGHTSSGADRLLVIDSISHQVVWSSIDMGGPFYGIAVENVDGVGSKELIYTSFESDAGYEPGILTVRNGLSKEVLGTHVSPDFDFQGSYSVSAANVDTDPQLEIFKSTGNGYSSSIECLDGLTLQEQYQTPTFSDMKIMAVKARDIDNDGRPELLVAFSRISSSGSGNYLYVYDGATGTFLWRSTSIGVTYATLAFLDVANVDADSNLEIIVADAGGQLFCYDAVTRLQQMQTPFIDVSSVRVGNLDADPQADIAVGTEQGDIHVIDVATGLAERTLANVGDEVHGLEIADIGGETGPEICYIADRTMHIKNIRRPSARPWSMPVSDDQSGRFQAIIITDCTGDGLPDLFFGDGYSGVRMIEIGKLNRANGHK